MRQWRMVGLVLVAALLLGACAAKELPTGYESLRSEVSLVEGSKYIQGLRDQYIAARQRGIITPDQFVLAVKADQTLSAAWNRMIAAVRAKSDSAAFWAEVIQATTTLENLLVSWIPNYTPVPNKPAVLGK